MKLEGVHGNSTHGYPTKVWESAKAQATAKLRSVARSARPMIAYSELVEHIGAIRFDAQDHPYHALLGQISKEEDAAGRGMLSVLVVHKTGDMKPGPGFFELADELGRDTSDPERFWAAEYGFVIEANR